MPHIKGLDSRTEKSKALQAERRRLAGALRAEGWTLEKIGNALKVSQERARQMLLQLEAEKHNGEVVEKTTKVGD